MIEALDRSVETTYCTPTFEGIHEMTVNGNPLAAMQALWLFGHDESVRGDP